MSAASIQVPRPSINGTSGRGSSLSQGRNVLVIGGEQDIFAYVQSALVQENLTASLLGKDQAIVRLSKGLSPDIVLLHVTGPHGLRTLTSIREVRPNMPIIVLSSFHSAQFIVKAIKLGAVDFIQIPFEMNGLVESVKRFLSLVGDVGSSECEHEIPLSDNDSFVCASERMNEIRGQCAILSRVDLPVVILGESGTGKEIIARYIHKMSPRAHRTFLKVNCAAMPGELLESELFGYEQGAFTGAVRAKPGKFEICNMGTILLDEIGEMPPSLQSKLLQVLQDGTFSRLGGRVQIKVDVRVIAATNIDMKAAIASRSFREDLYYRLNGFSISLPPLRERREEIPVLIRHFMRKLSGKYARQPITMSQQLLQACIKYDWPGNLRELENCVKRFLVLGDEQHMLAELQGSRNSRSTRTAEGTPGMDAEGGLKQVARNAMGEAESEIMSEVLQRNHWNRKRAAAELKISYKALLYKIRRYGLAPASASTPYSKGAASGQLR